MPRGARRRAACTAVAVLFFQLRKGPFFQSRKGKVSTRYLFSQPAAENIPKYDVVSSERTFP